MSKKAKSQAVTRNTNATYNMEGTEAVSPELNSIRPFSRLFLKNNALRVKKQVKTLLSVVIFIIVAVRGRKYSQLDLWLFYLRTRITDEVKGCFQT